ncbi:MULTISPECIES: alpha/beta hydrolase family protein [unclassified Lactococcus]|uniref:alpha/beta hydrolase n=1 Tax=unclassified Lactococcus TaxID=2643510 RepID=UPI0011C6EF6C|nr:MULTISPECIES: alpha/beta hydrolase family protein [unclassified Lactococcus]MQW22136.1 esterase family protein [Lactococcus sp. dk101]TXK45072.1 esterase family protein [Lactococcus sp. dk310]TXK51148.1 esterase family protein [Lactococcus sp. dk322]
MALINLEYFSEVLGMNRNVKIIYPEASKVEQFTGEDIPVLYLLHGMSGNENSWLNRSGIERLVRKTNLAIVMPSTDLGFYINTTYGMNYFDATAIELPQVIHNFFPNLSTKREKNFIAGLSMGGYGAFRLALGTDQFSYAASLSGVLTFDGMEGHLNDSEASAAYWGGLFGSFEQFKGSENEILTLAENYPTEKPKLYAWCGKQDGLFLGNEYVASQLKKLNYDLTYESSDGIHEWYYWTKKIESVLEWLPIDYVQEERAI